MVDDSEIAPLVTVEEIETASGQVIGRLTLNKPKAHNALDLEMAKIMLDALRNWQYRTDVLFIFIDGAGEKAFCAGGDVVSMHRAMQSSPQIIPGFVEEFFAVEYELDYTIRCYCKPVIVWGSGIVMGGGMGLFSGASHRIVTSTSRLAMPEITIGLYPDVGGSYFLPTLEHKSGLFLGLTGASINAADALYVGLADHYCAADAREDLLVRLSQHDWLDESDIGARITDIVEQSSTSSELMPSNIEQNKQQIERACSGESINEVVHSILDMDAQDNRWLQKAQDTLRAGSPITAHLVFQQYQRGKEMSLADCFRMELVMSCRCSELGEFEEGVRALLIDKDNKPNWRYPSVEAVPAEVVEKFFTSPWSDASHPLAHLGE